MSISREELCKLLDQQMQPHLFADYCPNGLQIEGKETIKTIAFAVSATKDSIEKKADCLIVHHGIFWKYQGAKSITGPFANRVKPLVQNEINLIAYHLPLDAHQGFGNAYALAQALELQLIAPFGEYKGAPLGSCGEFKKPIDAKKLKEKLTHLLSHSIIHAEPQGQNKIKSIGIITGGANNEWIQAKERGLDAYLTGEISEYNWHDAIEANIHYFAGGHNATESLGIQRLMDYLKGVYTSKINALYIPSDNPA